MDRIPEQLGVFPLPHVVLFPHALLPLHVFEPRYRALVHDAIHGSGRFVMSVLKPGYEESYHGKVESLGSGLAAGCADCHGAHGVFPAQDERSKVGGEHLSQTCGECQKNITRIP